MKLNGNENLLFNDRQSHGDDDNVIYDTNWSDITRSFYYGA